MEDTVRRLSPLSLSQQVEDRLVRVTELLRRIKVHYARCGEECFSQPPVSHAQWQVRRNQGMQPCTQLHDRFFGVFASAYTPANDQAKQCVFRCQSEHIQQHEGEEDLRSCEEQCYETLLGHVVTAETALQQLYEQEFYEKYASSPSCRFWPRAVDCV